jgi:hypothetical protein
MMEARNALIVFLAEEIPCMRLKYVSGTRGNHCEENNWFALTSVRIKW